MDICAAAGKARGAVDDHLVAGERDANQLRLGSRLSAADAAALGV
jgi:hypothetical protein